MYPKDSYPLPSIKKLVSQTYGYEMFSLMDGFLEYNQIPLVEEDQGKTTFIMEDGLYYYKVMPFRLKNVEATYQHLMDEIFIEEISYIVKVYIDDIIVKSKMKEYHLQHLQ